MKNLIILILLALNFNCYCQVDTAYINSKLLKAKHQIGELEKSDYSSKRKFNKCVKSCKDVLKVDSLNITALSLIGFLYYNYSIYLVEKGNEDFTFFKNFRLRKLHEKLSKCLQESLFYLEKVKELESKSK